MYYILIVVVSAGHIGQFNLSDDFGAYSFDGLYRTIKYCEERLVRYKEILHPKKVLRS
jgi:hypothetical protein